MKKIAEVFCRLNSVSELLYPDDCRQSEISIYNSADMRLLIQSYTDSLPYTNAVYLCCASKKRFSVQKTNMIRLIKLFIMCFHLLRNGETNAKLNAVPRSETGIQPNLSCERRVVTSSFSKSACPCA